jgi:hypothetical protein
MLFGPRSYFTPGVEVEIWSPLRSQESILSPPHRYTEILQCRVVGCHKRCTQTQPQEQGIRSPLYNMELIEAPNLPCIVPLQQQDRTLLLLFCSVAAAKPSPPPVKHFETLENSYSRSVVPQRWKVSISQLTKAEYDSACC